MPDWLDSTIIVAIIGAVGLIIQNAVNRQGRKEEVTATERDSLVKRLGEQVDRLESAQQQDRKRIDWLEDEIWTERAHSHRLRRGLSDTTDWGPRMVSWAQGDQKRPYPAPPDWDALRDLLDTPRPRRPPPIPDAT